MRRTERDPGNGNERERDKKISSAPVALIFAAVAAGIGALYYFPPAWGRYDPEPEPDWQSRVIVPQGPERRGDDDGAETQVRESQAVLKVPMGNGEVLAALLTDDLDRDLQDEQALAYRSVLEVDSPIYVAYVDEDPAQGVFRRLWSAPSAAVRPETAAISSRDLIGDRSVCLILEGMDREGLRTMTVFRITPPDEFDRPAFTRIAEIRVDGYIAVREVERTQAYQRGMARGAAFAIAAYGRDPESSNILDQIEITYAYDEESGEYRETGRTRIPGSQVEERRVREVLGSRGAFESFLAGLWYYVSPQGTVDTRQYIYFEPPDRERKEPGGEVIFYGEEIQQVFTWVNSSPTRYGLYISAQNVSVTTLRRFLDIELESTDSIRVKVFEDVRLKIGVSAFWDGSYRRAAARPEEEAVSSVRPAVDAVYDSSIGRIRFSKTGVYEIASGSNVTRGRYVFFALGTQVMLELRASGEGAGAGAGLGSDRATYRIEAAAPGGAGAAPQGAVFPPQAMTLVRVRLGASGVYGLQSEAISMTRAAE